MRHRQQSPSLRPRIVVIASILGIGLCVVVIVYRLRPWSSPVAPLDTSTDIQQSEPSGPTQHERQTSAPQADEAEGGAPKDAISPNGLFVLSGIVVDEQGQVLDKISIRGTKKKLTSEGPKTETYFGDYTDPRFELRFEDLKSVSTLFWCEGYYPRVLVFSIEDGQLIPDAQASGGQRRELHRQDLKIVLEKIGDVTTLLDDTFRLTFDPQTGGYVADVTRRRRERVNPSPPKPPIPARLESNFLSVPHGPSGHPQSMKMVRCVVD